MRILNVTLTVAAVLVAALVLTNSLLGHSNGITAQRLEQAQLIARNAPTNQALLSNLASRVNQAASTDATLKDVLSKLGINVNPSAPAN